MTELKQVADQYATETDTDVYLFNGPIYADVIEQFIAVCENHKPHRKSVFVCLTTYGGDPHAAYQFARCLQRHYPDGEITFCIAGDCYSAGTLIVLGGSRLLMHDRAHLGPVDIQMRKKDEPWERTSGLVVTNALEELQELALDAFRYFLVELKVGTQVSTRVALEFATQLTGNLFGELYKQIDPQRIGEDARAMEIMEHYGLRLNSRFQNALPDAVRRLLEDYPAHECIIDREEAKELFQRVDEPQGTEERLLELLRPVSEITVQGGKDAVTIALSNPAKIAPGKDHESPHEDNDKRESSPGAVGTPEGREDAPPAARGNGQTARGHKRKKV